MCHHLTINTIKIAWVSKSLKKEEWNTLKITESYEDQPAPPGLKKHTAKDIWESHAKREGPRHRAATVVRLTVGSGGKCPTGKQTPLCSLFAFFILPTPALLPAHVPPPLSSFLFLFLQWHTLIYNHKLNPLRIQQIVSSKEKSLFNYCHLLSHRPLSYASHLDRLVRKPELKPLQCATLNYRNNPGHFLCPLWQFSHQLRSPALFQLQTLFEGIMDLPTHFAVWINVHVCMCLWVCVCVSV